MAALRWQVSRHGRSVFRRARVTDPRSSDYIPSECLVHLIRDAIRRGDDRETSAEVIALYEQALALDPQRAQGATLRELADSYDRSISTMRLATRAA